MEQLNTTPPNTSIGSKIIAFIALGMVLAGGGMLLFQKINTTPVSLMSGEAVITRPEVPKKLNFIYGFDGKYTSLAVDTGAIESFIPGGYEILSQHEYDILPRFLILQKDNQLYTYDIQTRTTQEIFTGNLSLIPDERVRLEPSISENDKFFITINEVDITEEAGMGGPPILSTRKYFFDATNNTITPTKISLNGCHKYDSLHRRFFSWPCGEGIGSSIPLSIVDLEGVKQKEVISFADFGLTPNDIGMVSVNYNNGYFLATSKVTAEKIISIDASTSEVTKTTYTIDPKVSEGIKDASWPYSVAVSLANKTIIIGGGDYITLLRFNDQNIVNESKIIPENELYANFTYPHEDMLFYQSRTDKALKGIDLKTWQITKTLPLNISEEITLIEL